MLLLPFLKGLAPASESQGPGKTDHRDRREKPDVFRPCGQARTAGKAGVTEQVRRPFDAVLPIIPEIAPFVQHNICTADTAKKKAAKGR